jgi:hypothetical protein
MPSAIYRKRTLNKRDLAAHIISDLTYLRQYVKSGQILSAERLIDVLTQFLEREASR